MSTSSREIMLDLPLASEPTVAAPIGDASSDYRYVKQAIEFISGHWQSQPSLEAMAAAIGASPSHLHHVFRRWAGLTPKAFLQALTLDHARSLLLDRASLLDTAFEVG